jgi:hypothetical protein
MKFRGFVVGLSLAGFASGTALAQNTVGELLAAGGKRLSKDEVLATLRGATVSGQTATGGETELEWKENGSISGYMTNATGRRGSIVGSWMVNDTGNVCRDIELRFRETTQIKDCFPVFRLGDQIYFPATASADPSAAVLKRSVKH